MSVVSEAFQLLEKERSKPAACLQYVVRTWRSPRRYRQERTVISRGTVDEMEVELKRIASTFGVSYIRRLERLHLRVDFPAICTTVWYHVRRERRIK